MRFLKLLPFVATSAIRGLGSVPPPSDYAESSSASERTTDAHALPPVRLQVLCVGQIGIGHNLAVGTCPLDDRLGDAAYRNRDQRHKLRAQFDSPCFTVAFRSLSLAE